MSAPTGQVGGGPEPEPALPESAATLGDLQNAAMRGSWWTGVQALVGLPLSVVVNLVVARTLGPHGFGLLATYLTAYLLILVVLNAGVSDATIQWGAAAYARGDRAELLDVCRRCAGFHLLVEAPLGLVAAVVLLHGESVASQATAGIVVAVTMYLGTTTVVLTAISLNAQLAKLSLVTGLATQLAVVTTVIGTHDPGWTWVARLVASLLVPIGAVFVAPRDIRVAAFRPLVPRRWPAGFSRYSVRTLFAGLIASLVFSRSELFVLDAYGLTVAAGLFALAAGLAVQITAVVDAMLGPLIPAAASLVAIGRERAAAAILRGIRLSALATAPIALLIVPSLAVLTPTLYGSRFATAGVLFVGLGAVSCVQSVLHPVTAFVAALRKPLLLLAINAGALVLDLALVAALVPSLGASGAVVGNSVGQVFSLAASTLLLRRHLGVSPSSALAALGPFIAIAVCGVAGSVVGVVVQDRGGNPAVAALLAVGVSLLTAAPAVLVVGGLVTTDDLRSVEQGLPRLARPLVATVNGLRLARPHPVKATPVPDQ